MTYRSSANAWQAGLLIGLSALLLRVLVGLHGYSGEGKPPKYGDYEAQRHWMEITLHTNIHEWYIETPSNPLEYWGIDYPPLSAYQSYLTGLVLKAIEPAATQLTSSRGYESQSSKQAMRLTVILSDLLVLLPSALFAAWGISKLAVETSRLQDASKRNYLRRGAFLLTFGVTVLQPALLLIDHGHFQYNGIALGLYCRLWAAAAGALLQGWHIAGSVLFTLSLNHKQMLMYFAPAFFAYLLGRCLHTPPRWARCRTPQHAQHHTKGKTGTRQEQDRILYVPGPRGQLRGPVGAVGAVAGLGVAVLATFLLVWAPFLVPHPGAAIYVLQRLVPLHRGLFEDYVANFWCATHAFIKWKRLLPQQTLVRACTAATLIALTPSCMHQILKPSRLGLLYCMLNSSLAFFLFSYQVHEKSILMPMLPLALLQAFEPRVGTFMLALAPFSMFPLLLKDGQALPYAALVGCLCVAAPDIANAWSNICGHVCVQEDQSVDGGTWGSDQQPLMHVGGARQEECIRSVAQASEGVQASGSAQVSALRRRKAADTESGRMGLDSPDSTTVDGAVADSQQSSWLPHVSPPRTWQAAVVAGRWWWPYVWGCFGIGLFLHVARVVAQPPASLPYLYDLLQTSFAFVNYAALFVYFNLQQLCVPAEL